MASNVLNYGDEAASLLRSPPLSGSPLSPVLPATAKRRSTARSRRVVVRLICSPFAAVFRATCARASANHDQVAIPGGERGDERGDARRPRLEELLRMEASSNPELNAAEPDMAEYDHDDDAASKESAIVVFAMRRAEEDGEKPPLATSKDQHPAPVPVNEQQQRTIVPFEFDVDQPAAELCGGGAVAVSLTVLINVKRIGLVLAALRAHSRALKGSHWRQADRRAAGNAELFYHRPIALGRRCRVQHMEDSPYL